MRRFTALLICLICTFPFHMAQGKEVWKIVQFPAPYFLESRDKGLIAEFLKALSKEAEVEFDLKIQPLKRALHSIAKGRADMMLGYIDPENTDAFKDLKGKLSDFHLIIIDFYIFSTRPLDIKKLSRYNIEISMSKDNLFNAKFNHNHCLVCSLKKLKAGRIDGHLSIIPFMDKFAEISDLKNLHRLHYARLPIKILYREDIPARIEEKVKQAFAKMVQSGEYERLLGKVADPAIVKLYKDTLNE